MSPSFSSHPSTRIAQQWLFSFLVLVFQLTISQASVAPTSGEYLLNSPNHTIFATALDHISILNQLKSTNVAVTVIAPTDEQCHALGYPWAVYFDQGSWIYHLSMLLTFHLISGEVTTSDIFDGRRTNITTLASDFVLPVNQLGRVIDYDTSIMQGDIAVSNGLIHIPDRVMIPPSMKTSLGDLLLAGQFQEFEQGLPYTTFTGLVELTQMRALLYAVNDQGLTTMIPIDAAFHDAALKTAIFAPENSDITKHLVMYHMAPANVFLQRFTTLEPPQLPVQMMNGVTAWFTAKDNHYQINGANFLIGDDLRSNGVAHFIDEFLIPPNVNELMSITTRVSTFSFETFLHLLVARNISVSTSTDSFVTIFAPINNAFMISDDVSRFEQKGWELHFATLLQNHIAETFWDSHALSNHTKTSVSTTSGWNVTVTALNQDNITLNGESTLVVSDLFAIDGVIHGVDKLLVPPNLNTSIYQQLRQSPAHSRLVQLIDSVGMAFQLDHSNETGITFIAPSDVALEGVDVKNRVALRNLLEGQVFQSNLYSTELKTAASALIIASNGAHYSLTHEKGSIIVGSSRLITLDTLASNGVIHTTDSLLIATSTESPFQVHTGPGSPWPGTPVTAYSHQEHVASGSPNAGNEVLSYSVYLALALMGLAFAFAILYIVAMRK